MADLLRYLSVAVCAVALVGVSGCASTPETRFYVLTPLPAAEGPGNSSPRPGPLIGLRPVELP